MNYASFSTHSPHAEDKVTEMETKFVTLVEKIHLIAVI